MLSYKSVVLFVTAILFGSSGFAGGQVEPKQNYAITWWVVDEGGGPGTSGSYSSRNAIGQSVAGWCESESYIVQIGFLAGKLALVGVEEERLESIPKVYSLSQNYPNPFTRRTRIEYTIAAEALTTLKIYDLCGRLVRTLVDEFHAPGYYRFVWDGRDSFGRKVAAGVYFYRLDSGSYRLTRKMLVLR